MCQEYEDYLTFLSDRKIDTKNNPKNLCITHTCFGPPYGSYHISDDDYKEFIDIYSNLVKHVFVDNCSHDLHVIERALKVGPFLIDVDFNQKGSTRLYTLDDIANIVEKTNEYIKKYIDVKDEYIRCYITEKKKPTLVENKKIYKDGFHIIYPHIPMNFMFRYYLLHLVCEYAKSVSLFDDYDFLNSYDDMFDKSIVINNGWVMYGSRKKEGKMYSVTYLLDVDANTCDISEDHINNKIAKEMSIRKFYDDEPFEYVDNIKNTINEEMKPHIQNSLTREQRIAVYGELKNNKPFAETNNYENNKDDNEDCIKKMNDIDKTTEQDVKRKESNIKLAKELLKILNRNRSIEYTSWTHVGWALHNISNCDTMFESFLIFSQRAGNVYDKEGCVKLWKDAKDEGYGIGSLKWWAQTDDNKKYKQIMSKYTAGKASGIKSSNHYDVACEIYNKYGHIFKCTSISKHTWYQYKNHRWNLVEKAHTLSSLMSTEVHDWFLDQATEYRTLANNNKKNGKDDTKSDSRTPEDLIASAINYEEIANKLKNHTYKETLINACANIFIDAKFEQILDSKNYLLGFENGVYDLANNVFRDGSPDDYISLSTGYDYEEFEDDHEYIIGIEDYFNKIMIEEDMRTYVYLLLASHLDGSCGQQKFIIWTGTGSNGKSTTIELMSYALGQYFGTLPTTIITKKRQSSSNATPELADKRGVRMIVISEPEYDDNVYVGNMKQLVGCDWIEARALYKDPFRYKPQFKLIVCCNVLPHISSTDQGTWRRIRVTPFESEFVDHTPKKQNQFKKNKLLMDKMKQWAPAFMYLLLSKYYPIYYKNREIGIFEPPKVISQTDDYKQEADIYLRFFEEMIEITDDETISMNMTDVYSQFKNWLKENQSKTTNIPDRMHMTKYLINRGFTINSMKLIGAKYKEYD